ncbi:MAG: YdcF family protein [Comamonadaceae bacterium]|nr:MAG: YdcF family protein [Comamonadaceae bacterium]
MDPGELKPVLTALVLPPAGPLLLALLGVLVATRRRALGLGIATLGIAVALLLSTNAVALLLAPHLMPGVRAAQLHDVRAVQAIVVLGGGVHPQAPEYGVAQPTPHTLQRLRYGAWLARQTGKPVGFAGGVGWAATGTGVEPEAKMARRVLAEYGLEARWVDDASRDTAENAARMAQLLQPAGIRRIALVTDASHTPRAVTAFRRAGFEVVPAPTDFPSPRFRPLLEWLPSGVGAQTNRSLLREWLGRLVAGAG